MAATTSTRFKNSFPLLVALLFFASCSVVRDYPARPFVYDYKINLNGDLSTTQRKELNSGLAQQLDDSIGVRRVQKIVGFDKGLRFFYNVLKNPPVYDSLNADKSIGFMRALLHAQGYYRDSINYTDQIDTVGDQQRAVVTFNVRPGKLYKIDSVRYNIADSALRRSLPERATSLDTLQQLTVGSLGESLLKRGQPFAKGLISSEFDRLTTVYRNNGYLKFSRDELLAVWDTLGIALLRPTFDPVEQAELFEALQRRRDNPVADIEVRLRTAKDSNQLVRYRVGNVTVYPDLTIDTAGIQPQRITYRDYSIISYGQLFKPKVIAENIYLHRGDLYDQRLHLRTLNRFNSIGAWRLVSVDPMVRPGTDTVDFVLKMTPATKYLYDIGIEGSQNFGNQTSAGQFTNGNLIGVNLTLQNRNFARAANQSSTSISFAKQINTGNLAQFVQVGVGQTIYFPRRLPRALPFLKSWNDNNRTSLAANLRYIYGVDYLNLLSINLSWGYEFQQGNKVLSIRIPNLEYTILRPGKLLNDIIESNQSYKYIYNDGVVFSDFIPVISFTQNKVKAKSNRVIRANFETSGLISGFFRNINDEGLRRFVKSDFSYQRTYTIGPSGRNAFAFRGLVGLGFSLPYASIPGKLDTFRRYMPFYKAYFAGGANSMRGWALRRLGPGSAVKSFAITGVNVAPERFGDMQLEANAEYRIFLADIKGVMLNTALFTDIGNVWYYRKNPDFPNGEFRFDRLWQDLAIAVGTGLRIDFGTFLKFRLDYAYKAKDPSPANIAAQNKWFYKAKLTSGTFQVGIGLPF